MRVSRGSKTPSGASNTLLAIPKDNPNPALLRLFLEGRQVLGGRTAQGLPSLQEAPSHPVEEARVHIAASPWGKVTPETLVLPKVTGTHRGSCSASEANGTLQGIGRGDRT